MDHVAWDVENESRWCGWIYSFHPHDGMDRRGEMRGRRSELRVKECGPSGGSIVLVWVWEVGKKNVWVKWKRERKGCIFVFISAKECFFIYGTSRCEAPSSSSSWSFSPLRLSLLGSRNGIFEEDRQERRVRRTILYFRHDVWLLFIIAERVSGRKGGTEWKEREEIPLPPFRQATNNSSFQVSQSSWQENTHACSEWAIHTLANGAWVSKN